MSLICAIAAFIFAIIVYAKDYLPAHPAGSIQAIYFFGLLWGVVAFSVVHRLVWILLGCREKVLNHPREFYTRLSPDRAVKAVRDALWNYYIQGDRFDIEETGDLHDRYLELKSCISLDHYFGFGMPVWSDHGWGLVETSFTNPIPLFIGWIWRTGGGIYVNFGAKMHIADHDENNSIVRIEFWNDAKPPLLNPHGAGERAKLLKKIKEVLQAQDKPQGARRTISPSNSSSKPMPVATANGATQQQARSELALRAQQGDPSAVYELGMMYRFGDGFEQNFETAFGCLMFAAAKSHAAAQCALGEMYFDGQGVDQDYNQAFEWFQRSASAGHANAQRQLGVMLMERNAGPDDRAAAFHWFSEAAKQGDAIAMYYAGWMHDSDPDGSRAQPAFHWYLQAAEAGDALSQLVVGRMYYNGRGVEPSRAKAIAWLTKAAQQGQEGAQEELDAIGARV